MFYLNNVKAQKKYNEKQLFTYPLHSFTCILGSASINQVVLLHSTQ
jgi:hypothetical protein